MQSLGHEYALSICLLEKKKKKKETPAIMTLQATRILRLSVNCSEAWHVRRVSRSRMYVRNGKWAVLVAAEERQRAAAHALDPFLYAAGREPYE